MIREETVPAGACENANTVKRSIAIEMLAERIVAVKQSHPVRVAIDGVDGLVRQRWRRNSCNQSSKVVGLSFAPQLMGSIILALSAINLGEVHQKDIFGIRSITRH